MGKHITKHLNRFCIPFVVALVFPAAFLIQSIPGSHGIDLKDFKVVSESPESSFMNTKAEVTNEPSEVCNHAAATANSCGQQKPREPHRQNTVRFMDHNNGTVTDTKTGLTWMQHANCFSVADWEKANAVVAKLADGQCGLSDRSARGEWRLPSMSELYALIDYSRAGESTDAPLLASNHPFIEVNPRHYWSATTRAVLNNYAWIVSFADSSLNSSDINSYHAVWAVKSSRA